MGSAISIFLDYYQSFSFPAVTDELFALSGQVELVPFIFFGCGSWLQASRKLACVTMHHVRRLLLKDDLSGACMG